MNPTGMLACILTVMLLLSASAGSMVSSTNLQSAWIGMRSFYYSVGAILSMFFLYHMVSRHSTNLPWTETVTWQQFFPLAFSLLSLFHSIALWRTVPRETGYLPQTDMEEIAETNDKPLQ